MRFGRGRRAGSRSGTWATPGLRPAAFAIFALAAVWSGSVHAQSPTASATAEALFAEGRRLAGEGKYAEACPKFEGAQKVAPTAGTLLNLADCYEKVGRIASAWASFRESVVMARSSGRADLVGTAQRRAAALEPRLPKLAITVTATAPGLELTRDGVAIPKEAWTTPVPVDPGDHLIEAKAPARKPARITAAAPAEGATATVNVPELEVDTSAPPPSAASESGGAPSTTASPDRAPAEAAAGNEGSSQRMIGYVVGGTGIVALGVGGIFALTAMSRNSDSEEKCVPTDPKICTLEGVSLRNSAIESGNVATIMTLAGVALIGTGVVLVLTAPKSPNRVALAPTTNGLLLSGSFR